MAAPRLVRSALIFTAATCHWLFCSPSHAPSGGAALAGGGRRLPLPRPRSEPARDGTGQSGGVSTSRFALFCETVPRGRRDKGAVVDRGGRNPARDVNGAAAPLRLAHTTSGEGGCRWQSRRSPGTLSRVGQGQWLCYRHPVWRQRVPERSGAGVHTGKKHFSHCAGHYTRHRGPERVSERRCSPKKVCLCLHGR